MNKVVNTNNEEKTNNQHSEADTYQDKIQTEYDQFPWKY